MNRQPCYQCGEMIANAIDRNDPGLFGIVPPLYVCADCAGDERPAKFCAIDPAAEHDREYHGGRFGGGEW